MILTEIPIINYLQRAVAAATETAYAGLILVVGRDADVGELTEETMRNWHSLHSVTREHFAFVCPDASGFAYQPCPGSEPRALATNGITVRGGSHKWNRPFWNARGIEPLHEGARVAGDRPFPKATGRRAITGTANELGAFLGLNEALIPCVAVLCLWEGKALILPTTSAFSLYPFLKGLAESFEETSRELATIRDQLADARWQLRQVEGPLARAVGHRRQALNNVMARWDKKIRRTCEELERSIDPEVVTRLEALRPALHNAFEAPSAALAAIEELSALAPWCTRLTHVGWRIRDGLGRERAAAGRLVAAEDELARVVTPLQQILANASEQHEQLKKAAMLSSHVIAVVPEFGLRTIRSNPKLNGPWPADVIQRRADSIVAQPLERRLA
ncbi:hypothetical protein ABZY09_39275 [Streptomyces sp. NPDC002928]|uniref:hypothetical protein n=1 Tax=Streptomyces sp. NPDC002928 TaxID=3154440 RepID=UPI0033B0D9A7